MTKLELYINPACSKCRRAVEILDELGAEYQTRNYLESPLTHEELGALAAQVEGGWPSLLRSKDLEDGQGAAMGDADIAELLAAKPELMQRPIARLGANVLVARPPELIRELF